MEGRSQKPEARSQETTLEKKGWRYVMKKNGAEVAHLQAEIHGDQAMLHHGVLRFSRSTLYELRGHFETIRADLRAAGVTQIVASSDAWDEKLGKYWKLMGFRCFGQCEVKGITVHFGIMEA